MPLCERKFPQQMDTPDTPDKPDSMDAPDVPGLVTSGTMDSPDSPDSMDKHDVPGFHLQRNAISSWSLDKPSSLFILVAIFGLICGVGTAKCLHRGKVENTDVYTDLPTNV